MYKYKATVVSVYDGDTIRVNIDLGLGIHNKGEDGKGVVIRLYGINTPEIRGEERPQGLLSRDYLRKLILGKQIVIETIKDTKGKYGRYLGKIYIGGLYVNEDLVTNGYAEYKDY